MERHLGLLSLLVRREDDVSIDHVIEMACDARDLGFDVAADRRGHFEMMAAYRKVHGLPAQFMVIAPFSGSREESAAILDIWQSCGARPRCPARPGFAKCARRTGAPWCPRPPPVA